MCQSWLHEDGHNAGHDVILSSTLLLPLIDITIRPDFTSLARIIGAEQDHAKIIFSLGSDNLATQNFEEGIECNNVTY